MPRGAWRRSQQNLMRDRIGPYRIVSQAAQTREQSLAKRELSFRSTSVHMTYCLHPNSTPASLRNQREHVRIEQNGRTTTRLLRLNKDGSPQELSCHILTLLRLSRHRLYVIHTTPLLNGDIQTSEEAGRRSAPLTERTPTKITRPASYLPSILTPGKSG